MLVCVDNRASRKEIECLRDNSTLRAFLPKLSACFISYSSEETRRPQAPNNQSSCFCTIACHSLWRRQSTPMTPRTQRRPQPPAQQPSSSSPSSRYVVSCCSCCVTTSLSARRPRTFPFPCSSPSPCPLASLCYFPSTSPAAQVQIQMVRAVSG